MNSPQSRNIDFTQAFFHQLLLSTYYVPGIIGGYGNRHEKKKKQYASYSAMQKADISLIISIMLSVFDRKSIIYVRMPQGAYLRLGKASWRK